MDPWDFFVDPCNSIEKGVCLWPYIWEENLNKSTIINESWRYWMINLAEIGLEKFTFVDENLEHIKIFFTVDSAIFSIEFIKSENYPNSIATWNCTYHPLFFQIFKKERAKYGIGGKNSEENFIKNLLIDFEKFVLDLNNVLLKIKDLNSFEFELVDVDEEDLSHFEIDETDPNIIIVRLRLKLPFENKFSNFVIILYLDVNDILAYPNRILLEPLLPEILQKIDPSKWVVGRRLYDNLLTLFADFFVSE